MRFLFTLLKAIQKKQAHNRYIGIKAVFCGVLASFGTSVWAADTPSGKTDSKTANIDFVEQDLSQVNATPHELAFLQVLSELCPPMLNARQKQQFSKAYNQQLMSFMPNLNTNAAMHQISSHNEYKRALKWARSWTATFPDSENRALCVEFAESGP